MTTLFDAGGGISVEGTPFGRYRLIEQLGRGGMGEVWRAHDTAIDRIVAIKMLLPHFAADEKFEQRFQREARAAARLDDPHVVPIYDVGEVDGRLYVTMRLIKGRDLQTLLNAGPLPPARAVAIVEQVAAALHAAHQVGLIHRDVKPSNILLSEDDFAYLIDFGIARAAGETGLTSTGATIGTWSYMAPERFRDDEIAPSSDIYALACVLYQCLTGELPFPGTTLERIAVAHMVEAPPKPSHTRNAVPPEMDEVIATGLAKEPAQRYRTAKDLAAAARAAVTAVPPQTIPMLAETLAPEPITRSRLDSAPQLEAYRNARTPPSPRVPQQRPLDNTETGRADPAAVMGGLPGVAENSYLPTQLAPQHPPAPQPSRAGGRVKIALVVGTVAVVAIVATIIAAISNSDRTSTAAQSHSSGRQLSASPTVILTGSLSRMALDSAGSVYVTDAVNKVVVKLAAGSSTTTTLPFSDLQQPSGIAVDGAGAIYVADYRGNRVVKLGPGTAAQTQLPIAGLRGPTDIEVDAAGTLFVADGNNNRVLKLAAGSSAATPMPFPGISYPDSLALDSTGALYVSDFNHERVLKLGSGSNEAAVLPFEGLDGPAGVAVDHAGNVYLADQNNHRLVKLAVGASKQSVFYSSPNQFSSLAFDSTGKDLYAVSRPAFGAGSLLKFSAG